MTIKTASSFTPSETLTNLLKRGCFEEYGAIDGPIADIARQFEQTGSIVNMVARLSSVRTEKPDVIALKLACLIETAQITLEDGDVELLKEYLDVWIAKSSHDFVRLHTEKVMTDLGKNTSIDGIKEWGALLRSVKQDVYAFYENHPFELALYERHNANPTNDQIIAAIGELYPPGVNNISHGILDRGEYFIKTYDSVRVAFQWIDAQIPINGC